MAFVDAVLGRKLNMEIEMLSNRNALLKLEGTSYGELHKAKSVLRSLISWGNCMGVMVKGSLIVGDSDIFLELMAVHR